MNLLNFLRKNKSCHALKAVSSAEKINERTLRDDILKGKSVILKTHKRNVFCGVGRGMRMKVNANIGTSSDKVSIRLELLKLKVAVKAGSDSVMDLSTGGNLDRIRREIIANSSVPVGTVPIYQAVIDTCRRKKPAYRMEKEMLFDTIEKHLDDGVSFVTVHCGVNQNTVSALKKSDRIMGVVSRGGAFIIEWMVRNKKENPLYEYYDDLLKIAKKHDAVLSLGDGMRPGCINDATDEPQIGELTELGRLAGKAKSYGVQSMIEGPGHIPLDEIEYNVKIEKKLCNGAPFYVLGPIVTDIAAGYDHISCAIGGALAGMHGADFLCYVTPSEHLGLPDVKNVEEGVIACRIAAHAVDIARKIKGARDIDKRMAIARHALDWKKQIGLSINPEQAGQIRNARKSKSRKVCTMCGPYCSMKKMTGLLQ